MMPLDLLFATLWPLIFVLLCLGAFAAYVFIKSPTNYWLKFALIPAVMIATVLSYYVLGTMLGYAAPTKIPDKFIFIAYNMVVQHNHKEYIELWIREGPKTRLVVAPWSQSLEQAMIAAKEKADKNVGSLVQMKKKKSKMNSKSDDLSNKIDDDFESNVLTPEETLPKEPIQ